jgi:hypothetical protein
VSSSSTHAYFYFAFPTFGTAVALPQVLYGATDLLAGEEFLHQLEELGRRSGIAPAAPPAAAAAAVGGAS